MDYSNERNTCGRCNTEFQGPICPNCGLVMVKDVISDKGLKKELLYQACKLLTKFDAVPKGVDIDKGYIDFYYMVASKDDNSVIAAFKMVIDQHELFFNYNNDSLQFLKSEGKELYETEFNKFRNLHHIVDTSANNSDYIMPISTLKEPQEIKCKGCGNIINPYDVTCKTCGRNFYEDFPDFFQVLIMKMTFDDGKNNISCPVPNNLKAVEMGENGYYTAIINDKPARVSYKMFREGFIDKSPNLIKEIKKYNRLGKEIKESFCQFQDGAVIYIGEVKLADNLFAKMEYEITDAKDPSVYDNDDFRKYLDILCYAEITDGTEEVQKNEPKVQTNEPNQKKNLMSAIIGIVLVFAIIAGIFVVPFMNKGITMKNETFKDMTLTIPSNYKKGEILDLSSYTSLNYYNNNCRVQLTKNTIPRRYNFETHTYEKSTRTPESLYENITLEEKTINGKTWYYHSKGSGNYVYDYLDEDANYTITILSDNDDECMVDTIVNSIKMN